MGNIRHKNLVRLLKWIANFALVLEVIVSIAMVIAIAITIMYEDEHLLSSFPLTLIESISGHTLSSENEGIKQLNLKVNTALIEFTLDTWQYYLLKILDALITMSIAIGVTLIARKLFLSLERESPFTMKNAKRLKQMAILLISFTPYTFLRGLIYRIYILNNISIEGKEFAEVPLHYFGIFKTDFSSNEVWINLDINYQALLMGATLLVIAEIFRVGVIMKEDNESIV